MVGIFADSGSSIRINTAFSKNTSSACTILKSSLTVVVFSCHLSSDYQNFESGSPQSEKQQFVADVERIDRDTKHIYVTAKKIFEQSNTLTLIIPKQNVTITLTDMRLTKNDQPCTAALGSGYRVNLLADQLLHLVMQLFLKAYLLKTFVRKPQNTFYCTTET